MKNCIVCIMVFLAFSGKLLYSQNTGEEIFKKTCAACHTIGKGRLVGPDLSHVYDRMSSDWLQKFIRSSQTMVKSGDTAALAIFRQFSQIPMPDNNITPEQITSIINYIKETDKSLTKTETPAAAPAETLAVKVPAGTAIPSVPVPDTSGLQYKEEFAPQGMALFTGKARFGNGASPCLGCHNINNESILGGGRLGLDLTDAYTRLGPQGLASILTTPPFPVMRRALLKRDLSEEEKTAVISLLKSLSQRPASMRIKEPHGLMFFILSALSSVFILLFIYEAYNNRKIPK